MTYLAIFRAIIVLLVVVMSARSGFTEDETSFRRAGVTADCPQGTVSFRGRAFSVAKVRALRIAAGAGGPELS